MGNILAAIENSAIKEVDAGGMSWRMRKISSADLARVGHAALAMGQMMADQAAGADADQAENNDDEVAARVAAQPVEQLQTMAKLKDAVIAAGLMAVGDPATGEWEDVEAVLDRNKSAPADGVLWVGAIPNEVADELFQACMDLSTDGGAALERLRSFRTATRNPTRGRSTRAKVRKTAK
jgi:hypothetical protein